MVGEYKQDIYLYSYIEIEKEVLELTKSIYFTDEHFNVYSAKIADLIIRCSVEVESIAKELHKINDYEKYTETGQCFKHLNEHLKLSKKEVMINSPYFHFSKYENEKFLPFNYEIGSIDDYYKVFCSLKHDRVNNLNKATIYILIRILGALYILNVYFLNKKVNLGHSHYNSSKLSANISSIFNYSIFPCIDDVILDSEKNINEEECIYKIIRRESDYAIRVEYEDLFDERKVFKIIQVSDNFQNYIRKNLGRSINEDELFNTINTFFTIINNIDCNTVEDVKDMIYNVNKIKKIISISFEKMQFSYWLELNKG